MDSFGKVFFSKGAVLSRGDVMKTMQSTLATLLVGLCVSTAAHAITLCDDFGKTWSLTVSGDTLVGSRDTKNLLGCGALYVRGMFSNAFGPTHFVMTSMRGSSPTGCTEVIWDGTWNGTSGSGTWYNNNGTGTGSFSLTSAACDAPAVGNIGSDPSK